MKFEVKCKPSYAMLVANLSQGESVAADVGAMTYMDPTIEVRARTRK